MCLGHSGNVDACTLCCLQHEIKCAAQDSDKLEEDNVQLQQLVSTLQSSLEDNRHKLMAAQQCAAMSTADAKLARCAGSLSHCRTACVPACLPAW